MKQIRTFDLSFYFISSYFVFQQEIFTKLTEMINCEHFKFDDTYSESYLRNYLGIKCYTSTHYLWTFFIVFPSFLFYGMAIPLFIQIFISLKKSILYERVNIVKYDFLMRQYFKPKNSIWYEIF